MKNTINIISAMLLIGTLIFVLSCSKEEIISENQNQPTQLDFGQQVTKVIKDFKQKVAFYQENPGYKSGEIVSVDSALFLLESTMNYSHSFTMDYYDAFMKDTLTLVVPKNAGGDVDMDVLAQKYQEMKTDVTAVYNNSNFNNKGLVIVDISEASQTSSEVTLDVGIVTGDRGQTTGGPGIDGPFEEGDNWWYGEDAGKCDGSQTYSDAAQELAAEMEKYIYHYNQDHYIAYFVKPFSTIHKIGGHQNIRRPNDILDNHLDYYLYYADEDLGISDDTLCVEWPEMNLYFSYLKYLLYTKIVDELPYPGFKPAQIIDFEGVHDEENKHCYHHGWFLYGIPVYYEEGEGPEEL